MALKWTSSAERDLVRLHEFLAPVNSSAASKIVHDLVAGADRLHAYPKIGFQLKEFEPREVRRLFIGEYELRYEVTESTIYILRLWHAREDR